MKYIKYFEMKFEEDWEDDDPDSGDKGPFDDILIYGENGPVLYDGKTSFKCGDRVKVNREVFPLSSYPKEYVGTVVHWAYNYLICFDNSFKYGHSGNMKKNYNIPMGHGYWVDREDLKKI